MIEGEGGDQEGSVIAGIDHLLYFQKIQKVVQLKASNSTVSVLF